MVDLELIKRYLDPKDIVIEEGEEEFYSSVLEGTVAFVEDKCNIQIDNSSSPSILLLVSKLFRYNLMSRPHLKDMRTDDMRLVFSTDYPQESEVVVVLHPPL